MRRIRGSAPNRKRERRVGDESEKSCGEGEQSGKPGYPCEHEKAKAKAKDGNADQRPELPRLLHPGLVVPWHACGDVLASSRGSAGAIGAPLSQWGGLVARACEPPSLSDDGGFGASFGGRHDAVAASVVETE